jgi:hypothetical protein
MLIDVPSHADRILFRVQSFFTIEELRAVIGSHLIRLPKEAPNDYFKYSDLTAFACASGTASHCTATKGVRLRGGKNLEVCEGSDFDRLQLDHRYSPSGASVSLGFSFGETGFTGTGLSVVEKIFFPCSITNFNGIFGLLMSRRSRFHFASHFVKYGSSCSGRIKYTA